MAGPVKVYYTDDQITLHQGDSLEVMRTLPDCSVDCIVTSPPYYGLRDYGNDGQYGLEPTPDEYVETMRALFAEARRVLADDGTFWLNIGDSYGPGKALQGIPWRVALALQTDGWILRNSIIWYKPNGMPESVTDRLSGKHENIFMFTKKPTYWFDLDALREPLSEDRAPSRKARKPQAGWKENSAKGEYKPNRGGTAWSANANNLPGVSPQQDYLGAHENGKNPGDVWPINTQPFGGAHFAVFPQELARRCIVAGCKPGGVVLDTFSGSGTTGLVAQRHGRKYVGIDLSADYLKLSLETRLQQTTLDFQEEAS
jgi:site-specific DNA-methyltransferase (cytosine-N4-specific)